MRKLNLRVLQRQQEVQAQASQRLQLVVRRVAAQQGQVQRALERAQQQVRLALRERLRERYRPLVQPSQALVWLVLSVRLLWRRLLSTK